MPWSENSCRSEAVPDIIYPYELAYAYYAKAEYKQACKKLESIYDHKDASDRVFQLLGIV
ncbi:MAG: hypothetical protein IPH45_08195 [Bacteroidales bacterium]|nr:hypothetical protein [Bacteroidales bacterium]